MKKTKIILILLFTLFTAFSLSNRVEAYFKDQKTVENQFTFKRFYDVTYKYYIEDEKGNRYEVKDSVSEKIFEDEVVEIGTNLMTYLNYEEVKTFVNGTEYTSNRYIVRRNITVEEVYYLRKYTITYNLRDGTLDNPITVYTEKTPTFDLPTPTKDGYEFLGWTDQEDFEQNEVITEATTLEIDKEYNAGTQGSKTIEIRTTQGNSFATYVDIDGVDRLIVYRYEPETVVQYSNDGGTTWTTIENWITVNGVDYQYFTFANGGKNEDSGISTYDGNFTEYVDELEELGTHLFINPYTVLQGTKENIEVTAVWKTVPKQTYTITFNRNGGSGTMASQTFTEGVSQKLTANSFTRGSGWNRYTFAGWATEDDPDTVVYTDEQEITVTENMTLYAVWTR